MLSGRLSGQVRGIKPDLGPLMARRKPGANFFLKFQRNGELERAVSAFHAGNEVVVLAEQAPNLITDQGLGLGAAVIESQQDESPYFAINFHKRGFGLDDVFVHNANGT